MVSFKQAFNAARKAGNRYFSWNGNDYNTMTKEEQDSGIGDYFSKFKGNVGNNSNFQKAASNMVSQMMGVFQNPTEGKYAGQDYNIGIYFKPQFNSPATNQLIDQATLPPSTQEITSINTPVINNFNRSQVRALMSQKGLDPYAYTGGQRKALRKALNSGQDIEAIFKQWSQDNQPISYNAEGGLLKFEDGGMLEDFKKWLYQKLRKGELEESDLSKEKLAQLYQTFKKEQQGVQTAMNGAKLNYINKLNGKCPQGTHLSYYRIGGTLCKKCEADAYNESSDPIKAFKQKCGGKVKKAVKQKCGGKVKKKELGGEVDNKKSKLVKKPQPKLGVTKLQTPTKPTNKRPGPKDLKTLPNGKYPKYWTAYQRGQWDRDHNEGD